MHAWPPVAWPGATPASENLQGFRALASSEEFLLELRVMAAAVRRQMDEGMAAN
jgi:hypothetical protein